MCAVRALNSWAGILGLRRRLRQRTAHFAKVHGLDTFASQRGTDGRAGTGLASSDNELHDLVGRGASFRHDARWGDACACSVAVGERGGLAGGIGSWWAVLFFEASIVVAVAVAVARLSSCVVCRTSMPPAVASKSKFWRRSHSGPKSNHGIAPTNRSRALRWWADGLSVSAPIGTFVDAGHSYPLPPSARPLFLKLGPAQWNPPRPQEVRYLESHLFCIEMGFHRMCRLPELPGRPPSYRPMVPWRGFPAWM